MNTDPQIWCAVDGHKIVHVSQSQMWLETHVEDLVVSDP